MDCEKAYGASTATVYVIPVLIPMLYSLYILEVTVPGIAIC